MLYIVFVIFAFLYNLWKFFREKTVLISSLKQATSESHRHMILAHWYHIFIFELFLGIIVAHFITEKSQPYGVLEFGFIYVILAIIGLAVYQIFLRHLEKISELSLKKNFNHRLLRELRVSYTLIMLPIILYATIDWAFKDSLEGWGNFWFLGMISNILFVSVLTISCIVVIMLYLIPNREITEPEYLEVIHKHLSAINVQGLRLRWIETDIKNAFVVGIKLFNFSNQTMFVGKKFRELLTIEEFGAVIAHELAHVANRHIQKRMLFIVKNFISGFLGLAIIVPLLFILFYLGLGEDIELYYSRVSQLILGISLSWFLLNYALLFDAIRSQEYEADAFAVMKLGVPFEVFKSTLEKLTATDDLPIYLQQKTKPKKEKKKLNWIAHHFSTHPNLEERISSLKYKIHHGLPFNYYVSKAARVTHTVTKVFQPKFLAPLMILFIAYGTWLSFSLKEGKRMVNLIKESNSERIMKDYGILSSINKNPFIVGRSLMFYIVFKKDQKLIDFYLARGANPGRTMLYISELKNKELFEHYFSQLGHRLSQEEFYLVLHRTAKNDFTEAYRLLVNSKRFENLDSEQRQNLVDINRDKHLERSPASNK